MCGFEGEEGEWEEEEEPQHEWWPRIHFGILYFVIVVNWKMGEAEFYLYVYSRSLSIHFDIRQRHARRCQRLITQTHWWLNSMHEASKQTCKHARTDIIWTNENKKKMQATNAAENKIEEHDSQGSIVTLGPLQLFFRIHQRSCKCM